MSMFRLYSKRQFTTNGGNLVKKSTRGKVALLELNRPEALNSLNSALVTELITKLNDVDSDDSVASIVITGNNKAFAAGADIAEMAPKDYSECHKQNFLANWADISRIRKPIIAAVNGYALGGGFELALLCDIIYAGRFAKFGLPEIKLGTIPGGGGTQRLIRAIGKSNAMELILTGRHISADEAFRMGIVSKVYDDSALVEEAVKLGQDIGNYSQLASASAKEAVLKAEDLPLSLGLDYERKLFHGTFATADRFEGMNAFLQKKKPEFKNK